MAFSRRDLITKKQLLGQILIKRNLITAEQLKEALDIQKNEGGVLGEILVKQGHLTERDIVVALIVQCGFPYIAVNKYSIDDEVTKLIPEAMAKENHVMPLDKVGDVLSVVMSNPLNLKMIQELEKVSGCRLATFIATKAEIDEAIAKWYNRKDD